MSVASWKYLAVLHGRDWREPLRTTSDKDVQGIKMRLNRGDRSASGDSWQALDQRDRQAS